MISTAPACELRLTDAADSPLLCETVRRLVDEVEAIDVHTHLFPPSHGSLMLSGVDALLTYHYLVSEFFMVAPDEIDHASFFALDLSSQADLVWDHLFVRRSPLSEACIGVLTTMRLLGRVDAAMESGEVGRAGWLPRIRAQEAASTPDETVEHVFKTAKLKYCIMTNIPFEPNETQHWRPTAPADNKYFKSALRVDPLLKGDWPAVAAALTGAGYEATLDGTRAFLVDWIKTMNPVYFMASTPHDFQYPSPPNADGAPSASDMLDKVLMPLAEEYGLPIALKLGAHRCCFPALAPCGGGDGVIVADTAPLKELCLRYPRVKFLATFLSKVNQHEVCIMAQKLRNLHIYGCWWYCNNPSIIDEITRMRLELLGTAFTAQHSDSRILEQLVYKWAHSRICISKCLEEQYTKLRRTGWIFTEEALRMDVWRLFGGSYEEFLHSNPTPPTPPVPPANAVSVLAEAGAVLAEAKESDMALNEKIKDAYAEEMNRLIPGEFDYVAGTLAADATLEAVKRRVASEEKSGDGGL